MGVKAALEREHADQRTIVAARNRVALAHRTGTAIPEAHAPLPGIVVATRNTVALAPRTVVAIPEAHAPAPRPVVAIPEAPAPVPRTVPATRRPVAVARRI